MARKKTTKEPLSKIWMIRRKSDGLFSSCKSASPSFSNEGGVFHSEARLISHVKMITKFHKQFKQQYESYKNLEHPYKDCEIVQYSVVEDVSVPFEDYGQ